MSKHEVYYTRASSAEDAYELRQAPDAWAVCEMMENGKDRVVAYCPTLDDAERIKALLVYYGQRMLVNQHQKQVCGHCGGPGPLDAQGLCWHCRQ